MDYRPYILAGTFLLLIVALVTFVATLLRARRQPTRHYVAPEVAVAGDQAQAIDTDLQGLELTVDSDAPSAALLTPLRTGEWMPPEAPAPAENLPAVSLEERIAGFEPEPAVPEPSFAVESYQAWEVGPEADAPVVAAPAGPPDWTGEVPPVRDVAPSEEPDEFGEEIRALLPESEPTGEDAAEGELTQILTALEATPAETAPAPEPVPAPAPETVLAPVVEATLPAPEQVAPASIAAEAAHEEPTAELPVAYLPGDGEPEPGEDVQEWVELLRETQVTETRPVAVAPSAAPRPPVSVASATAPVPAPAQPAPVATPRRSRPSARVHGVRPDEAGHDVQPPPRLSPAPQASRSRGDVEDIVMAAPVEMWFGEARVGVKAGTATYERFRKYADVLLDDLKAHPPQSR